MKRINVLSIIFVSLLFSNCVTYKVIEGKKGVFNTTEMGGNLTKGDLFSGSCYFDLFKLSSGKDNFFAVRITNTYSGSGFNIKRNKGIRVILNGNQGFFLRYRKRPSYVVTTTTTGGTMMPMGGGMGMGGGMMMTSPGHTSTTTTITAECILTNTQLKYLLISDDIVFELISPDKNNGVPVKRTFQITKENKENLMRFYREEIKGMKRSNS